MKPKNRICRFCGRKLQQGPKKTTQLYCSDSCRVNYYTALKSLKIYKESPEKFISEELNKPVNDIMPNQGMHREIKIMEYSNTKTILYNMRKDGKIILGLRELHSLDLKQGDGVKVTVEVVVRS